MKKLLALTMLISLNSYAEDFFPIPVSKFQIKSDRVEEKLETTLKYPEKLLKRFQPQGAKISDKQVSNNTIRFKATKSVALFTKTVNVNGVLDSEEDNKGCKANEQGYNIVLNLDGSDGLVSDNIDRLEAKLCATYPGPSAMNATVSGKIIKGNNYSSLVGGVAKDIIQAQVAPLIKALTEEIQSMQ
jgi:hypothetical protein